MLNSGFSVSSAKLIVVHGVARFNEIVRCSELPHSDPKYKPIHCDKHFNVLGRKLKKYLAKSSWYNPETKAGPNWRTMLPQKWKGSKPLQNRLPGMTFSTVLQVQNSKGGRLLKEIVKIEPRLAKNSGYNVKIVEKGGKPLS